MEFSSKELNFLFLQPLSEIEDESTLSTVETAAMTTVQQNLASSLVGLASQKARVSRQWSHSYLAAWNNHAIPAYSGYV